MFHVTHVRKWQLLLHKLNWVAAVLPGYPYLASYSPSFVFRLLPRCSGLRCDSTICNTKPDSYLKIILFLLDFTLLFYFEVLYKQSLSDKQLCLFGITHREVSLCMPYCSLSDVFHIFVYYFFSYVPGALAAGLLKACLRFCVFYVYFLFVPLSQCFPLLCHNRWHVLFVLAFKMTSRCFLNLFSVFSTLLWQQQRKCVKPIARTKCSN